MKKLVFLLLFICSSAMAGTLHDFKVLRVIDGDTVEFEAKFLPDPLTKRLSVRIYGIDTPEKGSRAKCEKEMIAGKTATEFARSSIASATVVQIQLRGWDKYGGRVLGDVILDGIPLSTSLVNAGHARPYFGGAKRSWCN